MNDKEKLVRISMTVPEQLLASFDELIAERKQANRSQVLNDLIRQELIADKEELGNEIMAGTITLVYDHSVSKLQHNLAELQFKYLDEVISSLNVNLTHPYTLSVILVQGPGATLKRILNKMKANRGVITGKLQLSSAILPQVHPLPPIQS
ncbi:nickel-responsive transcriptional regulator NikR [Agaribacterium haliotis]|uniref:nickel-responsive transcriptional regulator NikR n=1 Tax=Agaribacterium haliotis TaxID=2013869 RepID=UPI000BB5451F|nr:nickel-responsive transcriptional regulator NikR [Agaribacterium haliotis]